jgi:hypothetical protein
MVGLYLAYTMPRINCGRFISMTPRIQSFITVALIPPFLGSATLAKNIALMALWLISAKFVAVRQIIPAKVRVLVSLAVTMTRRQANRYVNQTLLIK